MARRTLPPPSWLAAIQAAMAAFTGEARVVRDEYVPATQTSFRGAGYRLNVEVTPQRALFGTLPGSPLRLQGETRRAPDKRLDPQGPYFPPDAARQVPYWDYARSNGPQPVLVVLSDPPLVRLLFGPDDDLADAVILIRRWTELPEAEQREAVLKDLAQARRSPVAYLAGFELLMNTTSDLPGLFDAFDSLPGRPGAAIQGIVNELYGVAGGLSDADIKALAWRLLDRWAQESDPAALSGYLVWFDAHRQRTWSADEKMKAAVLAQAERASGLSFTGPDAQSWREQVRYYASVLLPKEEGKE